MDCISPSALMVNAGNTVVRQIPDDITLVNVEIPFFSYFLEGLYAYRKSSSRDFVHPLLATFVL